MTLPAPLPGDRVGSDRLAGLPAGAVVSHGQLPDFAGWLREQQRRYGFPVDQYPGLFRYQAGVKKAGGSPWRKLRKLMLKPGAFFRDMFFNK